VKCSKLIFKGSRAYINGNETSVIETVDNQISAKADSIEAVGNWVVVTCGEFVRAWPFTDILALVPIVEGKAKGKAA
jgi:hypothetical protein